MWLARASRCSPWPNTKSSGGDAPLPPPLSSGAQGLFHGSVSFLGLSSLLLQRERTAADQTLLSCSFWLPLPPPPPPPCLSQSLSPSLSVSATGPWTPSAPPPPSLTRSAWLVPSWCVPACRGWHRGNRAQGSVRTAGVLFFPSRPGSRCSEQSSSLRNSGSWAFILFLFF